MNDVNEQTTINVEKGTGISLVHVIDKQQVQKCWPKLFRTACSLTYPKCDKMVDYVCTFQVPCEYESKRYLRLCRWTQLLWTWTWGTTRCAPWWTGIARLHPLHQMEAEEKSKQQGHRVRRRWVWRQHRVWGFFCETWQDVEVTDSARWAEKWEQHWMSHLHVTSLYMYITLIIDIWIESVIPWLNRKKFK